MVKKNQDYLNILSGHVHLIVLVLFPEGNAIFQDNNAPIHTAKVVTACRGGPSILHG